MTYHTGSSDGLLAVGKIVKAHGIKGEVKLLPYSGVAEDLLHYKKFFLTRETEPEALKVSKSKVHGKVIILKLAEINSRDDSESIIGREVFVDKSSMPQLAEDEFYWHELEGLDVVTDQGLELGKVKGLMATGANDIMVIAGKKQEYLVPVIDEIIVEINEDSNTLVIAPMPGLLEINDPDAL